MRERILIRVDIASDEKQPDLEQYLVDRIQDAGFHQLGLRTYRIVDKGYRSNIVFEETSQRRSTDIARQAIKKIEEAK